MGASSKGKSGSCMGPIFIIRKCSLFSFQYSMSTFEPANLQSKNRRYESMAFLRTRPAWVQLLIFFGLAAASFMFLSLIGIVILSGITGIKITEMGNTANWDFSKPGMITFIRGMLLIQFISLFLIPSSLFALFSDPRPAKWLGLKNSKSIYFILGVAALFLAFPLVELTGVFNQDFIPE